MTRLLILGGTGFVGRSLLARLVERSHGGGERLRVPTRRIGRARRIQSLPGVEAVQADVHDPKQLAALVDGCDAVVNLVAILHGSRSEFERVHVELPRSLAAACARAGVTRVVHVSALGVVGQAPSNYLRSKMAGEAALRVEPLNTTILRPSVIFGAQDRLTNLFAGLQRFSPVVPLACADARFQPVWVEDVTEAIVRCLDRTDPVGHYFECAGPDVMTLRELVALTGRLAGHPRPVIALPPGLGRLQARLLSRTPGGPLMSPDNLDSMSVPNVATGSFPGLDALGIRASALEAVAPAWLGSGGGQEALDRFRATARRA